MTLILAVPANNGIVLASDGQLTSGEVRASGQKIMKLNEYCAWGGSGELALIQRVQESMNSLGADQLLASLRDSMAERVKQSVSALLQLDFRTQFCQGNPQALLSLHPGDFVFVESRDASRILHITVNGTPEWIERPYATGNGAHFAYALMQKYQGLQLDLDRASLLAFKVIEEAIEVGAYGLGPPIHVWHVTSNGIKVLGQPELAALMDAARTLRAAEIDLLKRNAEPRAEPVSAVATTDAAR